MKSDMASRIVALVQLIMGIFIIGVGMFMFLPAVVNLPNTWFGAVLAIALFGIGGSVVLAAARNFRAIAPK